MNKQAKHQKDPSGNIEWINGKHPILTAKAYRAQRDPQQSIIDEQNLANQRIVNNIPNDDFQPNERVFTGKMNTTTKTCICPNCDESQGYRVCEITNRDIAELIDAQTKLLLNPRDGGIFGSPNRIRYNNALAKLRSKTDINEHKKPKGEKNDIQSD